MIFSKPALTAGVVVGIAVLCFASVKCRTYYKKKPFVEDIPENGALFFSQEGLSCFDQNHSLSKCLHKHCVRRNLRKISKLLKSAKQSVDICMYKLSCLRIASEIITVIKSGIKVRIICDKDPDDESRAMFALRSAGAFIRVKEFDSTCKSNLLMHHKFVVIDKRILLTGSLNWTKQAVLGNWEDAAVVAEPTIIKVFDDEFHRLWMELDPAGVEGVIQPPAFPSVLTSDWKKDEFHKVFLFGEHTAPCRQHMTKRKYGQQEAEHLPYCAYTALSALCTLIETAEKSISMCSHLLTLADVAESLARLNHEGVAVRIITDQGMAVLEGSQIEYLIKLGVDVRGMHHPSKMHHKYMVLDKRLVLFGSMNWSMQAFCGNSENLVFSTQEDLVKVYNDHFEELWNEFKPIDVSAIGMRSFR